MSIRIEVMHFFFVFFNQIFNVACLTQKFLIQTTIFAQVVVCYNRGRSFKSFRLFKIGFVASVRRATPRPGLWRLHPHKEGFFFSTPVLTSLTFTSCTQRLLECSRVCGANEISQRSHQLCCQPQKCLFITRTLPPPLPPCHSVAHPQGQLCCVTSDFDSIGPFIFDFAFFVCGHP